MKIVGIISLVIAGIFGLSVLGMLFGIISLPFHAASNVIQTEHDVIDKTINANNALYNYHWFKERAEQIKAYDKQIDLAHQSVVDFEAAAGARVNWDYNDKIEDSRLRTIEQGLRMQIENSIAEYNAHSKEADRNIFKDGLFPTSFTIGSNILGGHN